MTNKNIVRNIFIILLGFSIGIFAVSKEQKEFAKLLEDGKNLMKSKEYSKALKVLRKAEQLNIENPELYYFLGYAFDKSSYENEYSILKVEYKLTDEISQYFEKVIALEYPYKGEKYILSPSEKVTSVWACLALNELIKGNSDKAKEALIEGRKRGGFNDYLLEFGRNLLLSCPEDAILFTNGDMDTFLPMYAQLIEGVRTDVSIINVWCLNLKKFVSALPTNPMSGKNTVITKYTEKDIEELAPWPDKPDSIPFTVKMPSGIEKTVIARPTGKVLGVMDQVQLRIINKNSARQSCFAITTNKSARSNLDEYLSLYGLVYVWSFSDEKYKDLNRRINFITNIMKYDAIKNECRTYPSPSKCYTPYLVGANYISLFMSCAIECVNGKKDDLAKQILTLVKNDLKYLYTDNRKFQEERKYFKKMEKKLLK